MRNIREKNSSPGIYVKIRDVAYPNSNTDNNELLVNNENYNSTLNTSITKEVDYITYGEVSCSSLYYPDISINGGIFAPSIECSQKKYVFFKDGNVSSSNVNTGLTFSYTLKEKISGVTINSENGIITIPPFYSSSTTERTVAKVEVEITGINRTYRVTKETTIRQSPILITDTKYQLKYKSTFLGTFPFSTTSYQWKDITGVTRECFSNGEERETEESLNFSLTFKQNEYISNYVTRGGKVEWKGCTVPWSLTLEPNREGKVITGVTYSVSPTRKALPSVSAETTSATFSFLGITTLHYNDGNRKSTYETITTGVTFPANTNTTNSITRSGNVEWKEGVYVKWSLTQKKAEKIVDRVEYEATPSKVSVGPYPAETTSTTIIFTGITKTYYKDGSSDSTSQVITNRVTFDPNTSTTSGATRTGTITTWHNKPVEWTVTLNKAEKIVVRTEYLYGYSGSTTGPAIEILDLGEASTSSVDTNYHASYYKIEHYSDGTESSLIYVDRVGFKVVASNDTYSKKTVQGQTVWKPDGQNLYIKWKITLQAASQPETYYYGKVSKDITGFNKLSTSLISNITNTMYENAITVGTLSSITSPSEEISLNTSFVKYDYIICLVPLTSNKKFYYFDDEEGNIPFTNDNGPDYYANGDKQILNVNGKDYKIYGTLNKAVSLEPNIIIISLI